MLAEYGDAVQAEPGVEHGRVHAAEVGVVLGGVLIQVGKSWGCIAFDIDTIEVLCDQRKGKGSGTVLFVMTDAPVLHAYDQVQLCIVIQICIVWCRSVPAIYAAEADRYTELNYTSLKFKTALPDSLFTLTSLRKARR